MSPADEARVREIVREELQTRDRRDRQLWEAFKAATDESQADREHREQGKLRAFTDEVARYQSAQAPAWRRLWQRVRGWVRAVTSWWRS